MQLRRHLIMLIVLVMIPIMIVLGLIGWSHQPINLSRPEIEVTIKPGSDALKIAHQIKQNGINIHPRLFYFWVKLAQHWIPGQPKAGTYAITNGLTPYQIYMKMVRGEMVHISVTIIEGWTFQQMREAINAQPRLTHDSLTMTSAQLLQAIGARPDDFCNRSGDTQSCANTLPTSPCVKHSNTSICIETLEGLFFPDTYIFTPGASDLEIYKQAYRAQQKLLHTAWQSRAANLPYRNLYEALIMASIIEKETGLIQDRSLIAAVFINRLKKNMRLQTDPSVIYGLGKNFDGNLRKQDLLADTPYNTYTRIGLPPTPISLPSKASIAAALHPEKVDWLYFVARGDGSSIFSKNLSEHNRAVNQFQRAPQNKPPSR